MAIEITPIFPKVGSPVVDPNSWLQVAIESDAALALSDLDLYIKIETPPDIAYPVSPDYYGSSIEKDILTALGTSQDPALSGFERVGYWDGAAFVFESPADTRSSAVLQSTTRIVVDIRFDKPLPYQNSQTLRVRQGSRSQLLEYKTVPRPFYSPALGDTQSAFEQDVYSLDFSSELPECWALRRLARTAFDTRHPILATRRLLMLALERNLGFPDLATEAQQINGGYRTLVWQNVAVPQGLKDIDLALGDRGLQGARRAAMELASKKGIPKNWVEPVLHALDYVRIDLTYRVRVVAQIIAVAVRAKREGLV